LARQFLDQDQRLLAALGALDHEEAPVKVLGIAGIPVIVADAVLEQGKRAPGDESAARLLEGDAHDVRRAAVVDLVSGGRPLWLHAAVERDPARLARSRERHQPDIVVAGVPPFIDDPVAVAVKPGVDLPCSITVRTSPVARSRTKNPESGASKAIRRTCRPSAEMPIKA
jgi:hypothetical protein